MIKQKFNKEKAIEVLLFVAKSQNDIHSALKIIFFADKEHLNNYGRLIFGDNYYALNFGTVPSGAYSIVKYHENQNDFTKTKYNIKPAREPRMEYLSESDIECLTFAINKYKDKTFNELHDLTIDEAYNSASINGKISLEEIINTLSNKKALNEYLAGE